jgi:hypothetical protein
MQKTEPLLLKANWQLKTIFQKIKKKNLGRRMQKWNCLRQAGY